eukprot:116587_1
MHIHNIIILLAAWILAIYTSVSTSTCTYCVEETSVAYDPNNPGSVPDSTCARANVKMYSGLRITIDELSTMISRGVRPQNIVITAQYTPEINVYISQRARGEPRYWMDRTVTTIDLLCVGFLNILTVERVHKLTKTRNILSEKLTFGYIRNQVSSLKDSYDDTKYSDIGIIYNDEPRTTIETINYEGELNMNRYDQLYHPLSGVISKYLGPVKVPSREYPKKKGRYHRSCWDSITSCYKSLCCCYTSCN